MTGIIDGINFCELAAEKYWSFPSGYKKDPKEETRNMIFSNEYMGARKMDGAYYRFVKDENGDMCLQGRNKSVSGAYLDKIEWVPQMHDFFKALPNGTCILGEVYFPDNEGSSNVTTVMGCGLTKALDRQTSGPKLHYYMFDIWAYDGKSLMGTPIEDRIAILTSIATTFPKLRQYVECAVYFQGEYLWEHLQEVLAEGGEGVVITKLGSAPSPGKRTARKTLKIKKELAQTIDCFFTGKYSNPTRFYEGTAIDSWPYWENIYSNEKMQGDFYKEYMNGESYEPVTKAYFFGWAGSLEIGVMRGDRVVPIGSLSGLTEEIRSQPEKYRGQVIEVTAMEILPTGGLRHAKFVQFRNDLTVRDCTWDKIFGDSNE